YTWWVKAGFARAQRVDPASDRRYPLADVEVEPLHKSGIDGPATSCQDLLNGQSGAEHHAVLDAHHASTPVGLDNLGIERLGQRHPARFGPRPFVLAPFGLHPVAKMGQQ